MLGSPVPRRPQLLPERRRADACTPGPGHRPRLPSASLQHDRGTGNTAQAVRRLRNLAECLGRLGLPGPALETAAEALDWAGRSLDDHQVRDAHACLAWAAGLAGDTARAEQHFLIADQLEFAGDPDGNHLYSNRGVWWAESLARTGRRWAAQLLTDDNETLCRASGWNDPLARCERLLGQFALADDDELPEAGRCLTSAATRQRDAGYLPDLAETLPHLATWAHTTGTPGAAAEHLTEAIAISAPRGLVSARLTALTTRARLNATQAITQARRTPALPWTWPPPATCPGPNSRPCKPTPLGRSREHRQRLVRPRHSPAEQARSHPAWTATRSGP